MGHKRDYPENDRYDRDYGRDYDRDHKTSRLSSKMSSKDGHHGHHHHHSSSVGGSHHGHHHHHSASTGSSRFSDSKRQRFETDYGSSRRYEADNDPHEVQPSTKSGEFSNFKISEQTCQLLQTSGVESLFPIQAATFDYIFDGKDVVGRARTGTGKTLAFALPTVERLKALNLLGPGSSKSGAKVVAMAPTRELAIQVSKEFERIGGSSYKVMAVYGGTSIRDQEYDLNRGVDVVVGTPGRIIDLIERRYLKLEAVKCFILDEADQMLNFGFQEDVEKVINFIVDQSKEKLQTLLFSATIPGWINEIVRKYMRSDYVKIDLVKGHAVKTAEGVRHLAINCPYFSRTAAIADVLVCYGGKHKKTIIFTGTKKDANEILLSDKIKQECQVMHGDIPQKQREITLSGFKEGKFKCLIATDVASRGLDIPHVDLIIQCEPPKDVDTYIHRSGRTARAGKTGTCITFYTKQQVATIRHIERKTGSNFEMITLPQAEDLVKATTRDIREGIEKVSNDVLYVFQDAAKEMIEADGAETALAKALAYVSGYTEKIPQRSILTSREGYVSYQIKTEAPFRTPSYVWGILRNLLDANIVAAIKTLRCLKQMDGAVFDVAEDHTKEVERAFADNRNQSITFEKIKELPDLLEDGYNRGGGSGYGNSGYNNGYGGGHSSYGGGSYGNGGGYSGPISRDPAARLFVGNLNFGTDERSLQQFFQKNGVYPQEAKILKDKETGESRGIAFVQMGSVKEANDALTLNNKYLDSSRLRINIAKDKK